MKDTNSNIVEVMKIIFKDNKSVNRFLYKSIVNFLSKIELEKLNIAKMFNISGIYYALVSDAIYFIETNFELQKELKKISIAIDEVDIENSKSNLQIKLICEKILNGALKSKYFVDFVVDFLLSKLSTQDTERLKLIRSFFERHFIEDKSEFNFGLLRKNSIERYRYLDFIEKDKKAIKSLKAKVDEFLEIKRAEEEKLNDVIEELKETEKRLPPIEQTLKEKLEVREKLLKIEGNKNAEKLATLSKQIKILSTQRSKINALIKSVNIKYTKTKQQADNTLKDEENYLKLLPEMIATREKKIQNSKDSLASHDGEYLRIKEFLANKLNELKPDFDFDKFVKGLNKVEIDANYCQELKKKRDEKEKRYEGLPKEELEKLKAEVFKSEEEIEKLFVGIVNQALKNELNFQRISNVHFMQNNIKIVQGYLFDFLKKIIKNADEVLITGFGNFIMREQFDFIFKLKSNDLLRKVMNDNNNAEAFINYYNGKIEEDFSGKYKRPEISDQRNATLSPNRVISSVKQYKNYVSFLTKKNSILKELIIKMKSLKAKLEKVGSKESVEFKKLHIEYKETLLEIKRHKQHKESFISTQKNVKIIFEDMELIIAKTLLKKRTKLD